MHQNSGDIDVTRLIDDCGVNRFNLRLTLIAFLVVVVEGYDIAALAFALPDLMASWHITNAASLGPLLTASVVGMLIGAPLFGYLGDRFGRRWTTILSCLVFGFFTALVLAANNLEQIFALRLLAGLGLGGAAPNVIALVSEYAPAQRRAMMATIMFSGIGLGGALSGIFTSMRLGWEAVFWAGAVIALSMAVVCLVWLPESAKFLVVRSRQAEAWRILRVLAPNRLPATPRPLVLAHEPAVRGAGVTQLVLHRWLQGLFEAVGEATGNEAQLARNAEVFHRRFQADRSLFGFEKITLYQSQDGTGTVRDLEEYTDFVGVEHRLPFYVHSPTHDAFAQQGERHAFANDLGRFLTGQNGGQSQNGAGGLLLGAKLEENQMIIIRADLGLVEPDAVFDAVAHLAIPQAGVVLGIALP